jgi:hypothetical protein
MHPIRNKLCLIAASLALTAAWRPALADDGCVDFKWDVTQERALFAGTPAALRAGKDSQSAPVVAPNRFYKLKLLPQEQVTFAAIPGKKAPGQGMFAGIAALQIPAPGSYRFAIDLPIWIDVVADGMLVAAKDFQGQHACGAPHKIVEFELSGGRPLLLQFSNAASEDVRLTVTASPVRKL